MVVFNVALMLSDRAPGLTRRLFGDFAVRLSRRLDASERIDQLTDGNPPGNDAIVHIGLWAVATMLLAVTLWSWWGWLVTIAMMLVASGALELAQGRYTSSRAVQLSDLAANVVGVALGAVVAAGCFFVGAAVGVWRARATGPA